MCSAARLSVRLHGMELLLFLRSLRETSMRFSTGLNENGVTRPWRSSLLPRGAQKQQQHLNAGEPSAPSQRIYSSSVPRHEQEPLQSTCQYARLVIGTFDSNPIRVSRLLCKIDGGGGVACERIPAEIEPMKSISSR